MDIVSPTHIYTTILVSIVGDCYLQGAEGGVVPAGGGKPQLQLLHDITGSFRPGVLTAFMGVSGETRLLVSLVKSVIQPA